MTMMMLNLRVWVTALVPTRSEKRFALLAGGGLFVTMALAGGPVMSLLN